MQLCKILLCNTIFTKSVLQEGDASICLIVSEKQAIDATLHPLSTEDKRFRLVADRYWNARGGRYMDGGILRHCDGL